MKTIRCLGSRCCPVPVCRCAAAKPRKSGIFVLCNCCTARLSPYELLALDFYGETAAHENFPRGIPRSRFTLGMWQKYVWSVVELLNADIEFDRTAQHVAGSSLPPRRQGLRR